VMPAAPDRTLTVRPPRRVKGALAVVLTVVAALYAICLGGLLNRLELLAAGLLAGALLAEGLQWREHYRRPGGACLHPSNSREADPEFGQEAAWKPPLDSCSGPAANAARGRQRSARSALAERGRGRGRGPLRFTPTVLCRKVPSLRELDGQTKAQLWWQPVDYAHFVRLRSIIARAYKAVAKRRGLEAGSDFPAEPLLAHESRLGIRFGQSPAAQVAREGYTEVVLKEQALQVSAAEAAAAAAGASDACEGGLVTGGGSIAALLDFERLAEVAREAAARDRRLAIERAEKQHRRLQEEAEAPIDMDVAIKQRALLRRHTWSWHAEEGAVEPNEPSRLTSTGEEKEEASEADLGRRLRAKSCFAVLQSDSLQPLLDAQRSGSRDGWGRRAQGFGQTRDALENHGVSPTGRIARPRRRASTSPPASLARSRPASGQPSGSEGDSTDISSSSPDD